VGRSGGWRRNKSEAEAKEYIFSSAEAGGELNFEWDEAEWGDAEAFPARVQG
jgi:hypothetical protein